MWPLKTQCFWMVSMCFFHSVAEGRCPLSRSLIFYNENVDFIAQCVKTISFYDEICVSKHPSFYSVPSTYTNISFYNVFKENTPRGLLLYISHQFLRWVAHLIIPSQKCMKKTYWFSCKKLLFCRNHTSNAISCCKYAGSVNGTLKNTRFFKRLGRKFAFRCRGAMVICTTHQFLQWISTVLRPSPS